MEIEINDLTWEERLEIVSLVLTYAPDILADECEPEQPMRLWMDLGNMLNEIQRRMRQRRRS